eukprot:366157-Chlamydomonas_euryale.AAC.7
MPNERHQCAGMLTQSAWLSAGLCRNSNPQFTPAIHTRAPACVRHPRGSLPNAALAAAASVRDGWHAQLQPQGGSSRSKDALHYHEYKMLASIPPLPSTPSPPPLFRPL